MGSKDAYLIAYHSLCCVGWASVWALAVWAAVNDGLLHQQQGWPPRLGRVLSNVDAGTEGLASFVLTIFQAVAVLEIVHAAAAAGGLARSSSSSSSTTMQVMGRIVALVAIACSVDAQSK